MTPKIPEPKHLSLTISKNTQGRRLVIPDIHGCPNTFHALIDKIKLANEEK